MADLEFPRLLLHLLKGASTPASELLCLRVHEGYDINLHAPVRRAAVEWFKHDTCTSPQTVVP